MEIITILGILLASYLCGSIPFGLLLAKFGGYGDIRKIGSGNIGATNVLRTGNKKLAAATLLLDGLKGFLPVFLVMPFANDWWIAVACLGVLMGHLFPVWLKFKGGKGVATAIGIYFGLAGFLGFAACLLWLCIAALFRTSSLAALVAVACMPFIALGILGIKMAVVCFIIAGFIWWRHKDNIKRLMDRTEPKIGQKKS